MRMCERNDVKFLANMNLYVLNCPILLVLTLFELMMYRNVRFCVSGTVIKICLKYGLSV